MAFSERLFSRDYQISSRSSDLDRRNKIVWRYTTDDTVGTVYAADYFNDVLDKLTVGDLIVVSFATNPGTPTESVTNTETIKVDTISTLSVTTTALIDDSEELKFVDASDGFGIDYTGTNDSTAELQAAVTVAQTSGLRKVVLGSGTIRLDGTVRMYNPAGSEFQTFTIEGQGMGYTQAGQSYTRIDHSLNLDEPAFSADGMRVFRCRKMKFDGPWNPTTGFTHADYYYDNAAWTPGASARDNSQSPQCAIGIDTLAGSDPGGGNGYPNETYTGYQGSHNILLEEIRITASVVGVMHNPTLITQNGDVFKMVDCHISGCRELAASGQAQTNMWRIEGGNYGACRTCFNMIDYGDGQGDGPHVSGVQIGSCFEIFAWANGFQPGQLKDSFCEGPLRIGGSPGTAINKVPFRAVDVEFGMGDAEDAPPVLVEFYAPVYFERCIFGYEFNTVRKAAYNFVGDKFHFKGCTFSFDDAYKPVIGSQWTDANRLTFEDCWLTDGTNTQFLGQTDSYRGDLDGEDRIQLIRGSNPHIQDRNGSYSIVRDKPNALLHHAAVTGTFAFNTGDPGTITLTTMTDPGTLHVGDVVHYDIPAHAHSAVNLLVPALVVTSIVENGASDFDVTFTMLWKDDYYDNTASWQTSGVRGPRFPWAGFEEITCTMAGTTALTNVSPTNILRDDDFVYGPGIATNTRVESGQGTASITLDTAATLSGDDMRLWGDARVKDSDGNILYSEAPKAGAGVQGIATFFRSSVSREGDFFKTTIMINVTGLRSTLAGDIIGDDGAGTDSRLGIWLTAFNGNAQIGKVTCFQTPAGGTADIDIYAANEANGAEDTAITTLTETQLINHGAWTFEDEDYMDSLPGNGQSLYLVAGATLDADYTAGRFLIELWGTP